MPAVSQSQQRFFGAELERKKRGRVTQTDMSEGQLQEFASTKRAGLPEHVKSRKPKGRGNG